MNEYTKGAFECLSWLEEVINVLREEGEPLEDLNSEIDSAIRDIRRGVGVDFRERLRATV
jgi:hypothetical protein